MGVRSRQSTGETGTSQGSEGTVDGGGPSRNDLFHLLRNQRRRFAIHHLKRAAGPVDVGDLATQVAAWENDVPVAEVTSTQRRRVYNALQQTHIPELEDTGMVAVDRREVRLTERADELDIYLEVVDKQDIPWSEYYLGLGAVGAALLVVVGLDVGPFAGLADIGAGAFLATAVLASAVAHYAFQHRSLVGESAEPPEVRGE
jgi:hypothetical protein